MFVKYTAMIASKTTIPAMQRTKITNCHYHYDWYIPQFIKQYAVNKKTIKESGKLLTMY